jgi:hypothetical protein
MQNMPLYALEKMHEICRNMQKYAKTNIQLYAITCIGINAANMQKNAEICR